MRAFASVIVRSLLGPFGIALVLIAIGAFRRRLKWIALAFVLLVVASTEAVVDPLCLWIEDRYPHLSVSDCPSADVVFVLGGFTGLLARFPGELAWHDSVERFEAGVDLVKARKAPVLLLANSKSDEQKAFADLLRQAAVKHEIETSAIRLTPLVGNTADEAAALREHVRKTGGRRVIVVTSALHMPRAMLLMHRAGVEAIAFPVDYQAEGWSWDWERFIPSAGTLARTDQLAREIYGYLYYLIRR